VSWIKARLGDVCTLKRGYDLPDRDRVEGGVPIVSSSGITGYHNEPKARAPGVVTGRYGTLGEVFYVEEDYWPLNTALYVEDFKDSHPRFVAYLLEHALRAAPSDKAAVPGINRNDLHEQTVLVPKNKDAQQRFADILSSYDKLIANQHRRSRLLDEHARVLYREWFSKQRFPGHGHHRITGGIPRGWARLPLHTVAAVNHESLPGTFDGDIEYVDISSVESGQISSTQALSFRDAPSRARRVVRHGDVIWSCVRPGRRGHAIIWRPPPNLVVSTGFAVLTPVSTPPSFLYYATTTDTFVGYLENHVRGAAYPAVVAADFERAEILVPAAPLLGAFDQIVEPLIASRENVRVRIRKLRAARDLLLPRLMNGDLDV
jgi:type I restriction enzyme S subunit